MKTALWVSLVSMGFLAVASCESDGGGGGGSCPTVTACGGDVVGSWSMQKACVTNFPMGFGDECPQATVTVENFNTTGTISFAADMTYTQSLANTGTIKIGIPASCLTIQGVTVTCAQLQAFASMDPDSDYSSFTCSGSTSCNCTAVLKGTPESESGTYAISNNRLTTTSDDGGETDTSEYCVQGTQIVAKSIPTSAQEPTVSFVLNKQ